MKKFKFFVIGKKTVIALSLAFSVAFLSVFCAAGWDKTLTTTANTKKLPIYCTQNDKKQIALSFDAAWGNKTKVQNLYKSTKDTEKTSVSRVFLFVL